MKSKKKRRVKIAIENYHSWKAIKKIYEKVSFIVVSSTTKHILNVLISSNEFYNYGVNFQSNYNFRQ